MSLLAIIPARGGSKGIPKKNIVTLYGKPLIAWTIEAALRAKSISRLIVSTDDPAIAAIATGLGAEVPFIRPAALSHGESTSVSAVLHALEQMPIFEKVLLLQPTSPLRSSDDIDEIVAFKEKQIAPSAVSISLVSQHPHWMFNLGLSGRLTPLIKQEGEVATRRQDLPQIYMPNGALYLADSDWIQKKLTFVTEETLGFVMPQERSIDIDTVDDLRLAELLMHRYLIKL
jgi:CMP-N,N'-diacetyllegionaminic acid synthase